jgi:hypothetical protein
MKARPDLSSIKRVAAASKSSLSNGKVGRIYAASHTTDIDSLQHLADVFGVQPWQLLVEGLKPNDLPRLVDEGLLSQVRQLVAAAAAPPPPKASSFTDELTVQPKKRVAPKVGPALTEAFDEGGKKNAGRSTGRVSKPKGRRGG